ncbi:MAG: Rrf2 family transcriptional regulator [Planctomycetota bacterium]|nr:Rrf2 family transcriptional regulator [Planctomycetota bacterium]
MITVTGEYALRAMAYMAQLSPGKYVLARDMGRELGIPSNYLSKVLQSLARHGLLESQRGRNGGFRLERSPKEITIYEILSSVEFMGRYETCVLGHKECRDEDACPIHDAWKEARGKVLNLFHKTPLSRLVASQGKLLAKPKAG